MNDTALVSSPVGAPRPGTDDLHTIARVLIVDGDTASLAATHEALQADGYVTAAAFDGAGALAVAERLGPFDLLVIDLHTGRIDAVAVAQALRASNAGLQVLYLPTCTDALPGPTIPLSAHDQILEKPFSEGELLEAVFQLLCRQRFL